MYIFKKASGPPCHPHLYHPLDSHHGAANAPSMRAILRLKVLALLAKPLCSRKPSVRHKHPRVCDAVFVFVRTEGPGISVFSTVPFFLFFLDGDPQVLSKLH